MKKLAKKTVLACLFVAGQAWGMGTTSTLNTLVLIDSSIDQADVLHQQFQQRDTVVRVVKPHESFWDIVNQVSQRYPNIRNIDLLSHAQSAELTLGQTHFNLSSIEQKSPNWKQLGHRLGKQGQLRFWGCDLASGKQGKQFVHRLSELTGSDVYASDDKTGHKLLGGDWSLEFSSKGDTYDLPRSLQHNLKHFTQVLNTGLGNSSYTENSAAVNVAPSVSYSSGADFAGGYIELDGSDLRADDVLSLKSASNINAVNAVSLAGDSVFLGDGSKRNLVGKVDATHNGQNGNKLRINFDTSFKNGQFESGSFDGWHVTNGYHALPGDTGTTITATASVVSASAAGAPSSSDGYVAQLYINGSVSGTCSTAHGPVIESAEFSAQQGSKVSVDWRAKAGSDDYDVYAYLIDKNTNTKHQLFYERGSSRAWATTELTVPVTSSRFVFQFIGGTYDRTCGLAVGATLYVDNAKQVGIGVNDNVVQSVARALTFSHAGDDPTVASGVRDSLTLSLNAQTATNSILSQSATLSLTPLQDAPSLEAGANVVASSSPIASSLVVSDVDDTQLSLAKVYPQTIHTNDRLAISGASQAVAGNITTFTGGSIPAGMSVTFDNTTKLLSLAGNANLSVYQSVLQAVTLQTEYPKRIAFEVSDGNSDSTGVATASDTLDITGIDYGDAYANYSVLASQNGARHTVTPTTPYLGTDRTIELNGSADSHANHDAGDDGVYLDSVSAANLLQDKTITSGTTFNFKVKVTDSAHTAKLSAWIDWNRDGDFGDTIGGVPERIAYNLQDTNSDGLLEFSIVPPVTALVEGDSIARFRLSNDSNLTPQGLASDGEVEDYKVKLLGKLDYGDAPDVYGSASHLLPAVTQVYLGNTVDFESGSLNSANGGADGLGDDQAGDDEDGLVALSNLSASDSRYSVQVKATNQSAQPAWLVAWLDVDGNQQFDADEATQIQVPSNTQNATFTVNWNKLPSDIQAGTTYLRLRLTTDSSILTGQLSNSLATTLASDGEVEDYALTIAAKKYRVSGKIYNDTNVNAALDANELGVSALTMVLLNTTTNTCVSTKTNANGDYVFNHIESGSYRVYEAANETTPTPSVCDYTKAADLTGYVSTTSSHSSAFNVSTADVSGLNFGDLLVSSTGGGNGAGLSFSPNNSNTLKAGNGLFYYHQLQAPSVGSVSFDLQATSSQGWSNRFFYDANCDGKLVGTEQQPVSGSINVSQVGQVLCMMHAVMLPTSAQVGSQEKVQITARFTLGDGSLGLPILEKQVLNTTTALSNAGGAGLVLSKTVRNLTTGTSGSVANQAKPNDVLVYEVEYYNAGSRPIETLKINDSVPEFTSLVTNSAQCLSSNVTGLACQPVVSGDALEWRFAGVVPAGAKGVVTFRVRVL